MTRLVVLPPDERPNTAGYARWIGECTGAEVLLPPAEAMPRFREPGDRDALAAWLREVAPTADHLVVSLDLLVHGGLVPSRLTDDSAVDVIQRLAVLEELDVPITAYQVITRLPHYNNPGRSRQEPPIWATHGQAIAEFSSAWDKHFRGEGSADDMAAARAQVPETELHAIVNRRLRNHAVNLAALDLKARGVIRDLIVTSDDTSEYGLPVADRRAVERWMGLVDVGNAVYPGADEVPAVLVARVMAGERKPRVRLTCANPGGLERVAPYEDQPVGESARRQVRAVGGVVAEEGADAVLVLHGPAPDPGDWVMNPPTGGDPDAVQQTVAEVERQLASGLPVGVADVRYANGSDPDLLVALDEAGLLAQLTSYSGWNTAGNTLGTALAAVVSAVLEPAAAKRRKEFLALKIIKDGHYLPVVRHRLQQELAVEGKTDPDLESISEVEDRIASELNAWAGTIKALEGVRVTDAHLTWAYLFTVDLGLDFV